MASASSVLRALRQRSTHGCSPSISRKPQCTTSWSSTTSTRRRRSPPPPPVPPAPSRLGFTSGTPKGHRQSHSPHARLALAELDDPAGLDRLERPEPHAPPARRPWPPVDAVVADLHHEGVVDPLHR